MKIMEIITIHNKNKEIIINNKKYIQIKSVNNIKA